mgnify:CR=1 FL=1
MASDECVYYYYDSGYSCRLKQEKEGRSSIDDDTVHKYCWGYHYHDCPRYKARNDSSGCFLTSACTEARGLPDDCEELTILRAFRDGYMKSLPQGQAEICEYYHIAPAIVEKIRSLPNATEIFDCIYTELVLPCVALIRTEKNEEAYLRYREYVQFLQVKYPCGI